MTVDGAVGEDARPDKGRADDPVAGVWGASCDRHRRGRRRVALVGPVHSLPGGSRLTPETPRDIYTREPLEGRYRSSVCPRCVRAPTTPRDP